MQRIPSLYQHWSLEAKKKSTLTNNLYQKHKFEMINGFKQFSTCHVQREIWCKEFHFYTKNWPWVKNFPNATIMVRQLFLLFLRWQPLEGGGVGVRNFFLCAHFFPPPTPGHYQHNVEVKITHPPPIPVLSKPRSMSSVVWCVTCYVVSCCTRERSGGLSLSVNPKVKNTPRPPHPPTHPTPKLLELNTEKAKITKGQN